ncbi:MAG: MarR family transcriptional regulator [Halalkalicoccus sp.]
MSIDIERFEEGDPDSWDEPTNAQRVLGFLAEHDDRAWKQSEIADRTGVKRGSIGAVLARLHERGLVRHRGEYWAITDDRGRLRDAVDLHRITSLLDERYGSERRSEWREHAADAE